MHAFTATKIRKCDLFYIDVPTSVEISWNEENRDIGRYGNLTCTCPRSKPPASLRWFKESEEITDDAIPYEQEQDSNGNIYDEISIIVISRYLVI